MTLQVIETKLFFDRVFTVSIRKQILFHQHVGSFCEISNLETKQIYIYNYLNRSIQLVELERKRKKSYKNTANKALITSRCTVIFNLNSSSSRTYHVRRGPPRGRVPPQRTREEDLLRGTRYRYTAGAVTN